VDDAGGGLPVVRDRRGAGASALAGLREEVGDERPNAETRNDGAGAGSGGRVGAVNSALRDELSSVGL
jgi:hypothetical protein